MTFFSRRPDAEHLKRVPLLSALFLAGFLLIQSFAANAALVRVKDIADFEGVRTNQLIGYGLVVGLHGTGDKLTNVLFTRETLISMLNRLGVNIRDREIQLQTHDVAAVMVTADLPAFSHGGGRIDVTVSATGDATDLTGGTLLVTPLMAADGEIYAVAQGSLATNAFSARGAAASIVHNIPTNGHIANGAVVEREVPVDLANRKQMHLSLRNPDFTTAGRIAQAINSSVGNIARVMDPRTISLDLTLKDSIPALSRIGDLLVEPDTLAKVVVDDASGTIVIGNDVRISTVAIAQGNLTIQVTETPIVSQPGPMSNGTTTVAPRTSINVNNGNNAKLGILRNGPALSDLVSGLNALGVGPRDMISILQAIKADGALQADLEVR
ncbi:flagellar basal body P-ring biosynthesis protein FlgA [Acetobacter aceti NRIC 0242]|uniref:Flagellar P-ring protein n=2 Tax=Acetobacter aceti TaxID=435 RepID=A0A6S6PKQ9_ACEAC|nr:flagellar basal body P-ring protein FlgI [Acetobacter aceti]GBO80853.1 flagellar basal body P-ring biosynthesis protein FlgA [Acetobacter aceti NRIC 0242]TCS33619.1 flagellar P-ring protein precursor FlgI [Acetobacter aceti NBRC 14818]BCI67241.1 flagellar P-ring protein [Acetobacter aceti]BCK74878.1 flagellar P-ring protein [Acetobacter aceti NBRC 14818]GAN57161.1 flagellar basal body P-ring protein [Acetobacter aceti NBRC 14818]